MVINKINKSQGVLCTVFKTTFAPQNNILMQIGYSYIIFRIHTQYNNLEH